MKTIRSISLAFLLIAGCSMSEHNKSFKKTMAVINEYSKKIRKEDKIWNSGYGLDYSGSDKVYDGKIHVIALSYRVDKNLKYNEARKYFYSIVDGLLEHINKNTQLQNYFYHYPVDYSDLELHFTFEDERKGCLKKDDVQSIHIVRNEIFYEISNEDGPNVIDAKQVSPDIYVSKGILERNRSIIRTVEEDLAIHKDN